MRDDPDKANPAIEHLERLQRDGEMLLIGAVFLLLGMVMFSTCHPSHGFASGRQRLKFTNGQDFKQAVQQRAEKGEGDSPNSETCLSQRKVQPEPSHAAAIACGDDPLRAMHR